MERTPAARTSMPILAALGLALVSTLGCFGPSPPPEVPTQERVAANRLNIGIPYGRYVLFRAADRYIALRVTGASGIGNQIDFEWTATEAGASDFRSTILRRGTAVEGRYLGRIDALPLSLNWSRGSADLGWIYWPEPDIGLSVCSKTFASLEKIDPVSGRLTWYSKDSFE